MEINFEALKSDSWSEKEIENVKLVTSFMQKLMNEHDFDGVLSQFSNDQYVQHNRGIPDGLAELVKLVRNFSSKFPDYGYDVKRSMLTVIM